MQPGFHHGLPVVPKRPEAKESFGMVNRQIWILVLTLALAVLPGPAQAISPKTVTRLGGEPPAPGLTAINLKTNALARYFKSFGVLQTLPLMEALPRRGGGFRLEAFVPGIPVTSVSPFSLPLINMSPLAARPENQSESANLPKRVLTRAYSYLNTPYRRGGSLQTGRATDCSGFVQHIYRNFNIDLPRSSAQQARVGTVAAHTMDFAKMLPGDLLFFSRGGWHIGHVGIYLGEGKMIHASTHRRGVTVADLRQPYYQDAFVVAKRLAELQRPH